MDWRARGLCSKAAVDPELFFPTATRGPAYDEQVAEAKSLCRRCPARDECLAWALESVQSGICGGMTEGERADLRRRRVRIA